MSSRVISGTNTPALPAMERLGYHSTQHDLMNHYFRKDTLIFKNIDLLRASDVKLVLLVGYAVIIGFFPRSPRSLVFHFMHALGWRFFHSFGLGFILKAQSDNKFLVRHFIKHYHYPGKQARIDSVKEAFANWKSLYNLSLCMTYGKWLYAAAEDVNEADTFLFSFLRRIGVADVFYSC